MNNDNPYKSTRQSYARRPQFQLRTLLGLTTLMAAVFAILGALGVSWLHVVGAFGVCGAIGAITAGFVELIYSACGLREPAARPARCESTAPFPFRTRGGETSTLSPRVDSTAGVPNM